MTGAMTGILNERLVFHGTGDHLSLFNPAPIIQFTREEHRLLKKAPRSLRTDLFIIMGGVTIPTSRYGEPGPSPREVNTI